MTAADSASAGVAPDPAGPEPAVAPPARPPAVTARRGMTIRGRCLLAGGIAAGACGILLDERDLLRVGLLAALLPLVAWAMTATRRTRLTAVHHLVPSRLSPGMTGAVHLVLTNDGGSRTRPIELYEAPVPDLSTGTHALIPALGKGRSAAAGYPLTAVRRGRFLLGPPRLRMSDPFATWEDNRTLPVATEVLVVPTVIPLHGGPASGGSLSAASGRAAQGGIGGDPDVRIRPYQRGDDIRTVHWRASARHDDLMVRLTEPVSHGGATVLLDARADRHAGSGADSSLEIAVSLAASIALHLLGEDHRVRLTAHSGQQLAGGHDIADDVLAALAVLLPDPTDRLNPAALADPGLLVAVLGQLDTASVEAAIAGRTRSATAVALVLAAEEWGHPADSRAGVERLTAAGWRVVVVHRGDDLALVWRRACAADDGFRSAPARWAPTGPVPAAAPRVQADR